MAVEDILLGAGEGAGIPFVRTAPSQERGAARIDALLDAAADVIDEVGFDRLTTAAVAERAEASIGTVYRYFPDRLVLLQAVRDRAVARFKQTVADLMSERVPGDWKGAIDCTIDGFAKMFRDERGFRILRFRDGQGVDEMDPRTEGSTEFAERFAEILASQFGFVVDDDLNFRLQIAMEIGETLIDRSFAGRRDGDQRTIEEARAVVHAYLGRYYPAGS